MCHHSAESYSLSFFLIMLRVVIFTKQINSVCHPFNEKGNDFLRVLFAPSKYCCVLLCSSCPVIEDNGESLKFNSQFESGNLRKAVQIRK